MRRYNQKIMEEVVTTIAEVVPRDRARTTSRGSQSGPRSARINPHWPQLSREAVAPVCFEPAESEPGNIDRDTGTKDGNVDLGYADGRSLRERIAARLEEYSTAADRAWGDARSVFDSCAIVWRGMQNWQFTYMSLSQEIVRDLNRARRGFFRCSSLPEVARLQRDVYLEMMRRTMAANVALLQVAIQTGRDAAGPLRGRQDAGRHR